MMTVHTDIPLYEDSLMSTPPHDRLQYHRLFDLFPSPVRAKFYNNCETRVYKPGEIIFHYGDDGPWWAALLAGRIRLSVRTDEGREMLLTMVERGEIFGERAVFDGQPRAADAIAETESTVMIIRKEELLPILFDYPEAMFHIIQILCSRMLRYTHTLELYALQSLPSRFAHLLLQLGQKYGQRQEDRLIINVGFSQSDLSKQLGCTRESVNKMLKIFANKELLTSEGDQIILLDLAALQKMTEFNQRVEL